MDAICIINHPHPFLLLIKHDNMSSFTLSGGSGSDRSHRASTKRPLSTSNPLYNLEQFRKRIKRFERISTNLQSDEPNKSQSTTPEGLPREMALVYTDELSTLKERIENMQSETMHNSTDDPALFAETMYAYYGQQFGQMLEAIEKMETESPMQVCQKDVSQ